MGSSRRILYILLFNISTPLPPHLRIFFSAVSRSFVDSSIFYIPSIHFHLSTWDEKISFFFPLSCYFFRVKGYPFFMTSVLPHSQSTQRYHHLYKNRGVERMKWKRRDVSGFHDKISIGSHVFIDFLFPFWFSFFFCFFFSFFLFFCCCLVAQRRVQIFGRFLFCSNHKF